MASQNIGFKMYIAREGVYIMNNVEQNTTKVKLPILEIHAAELVTEDTSNAKCDHEDEFGNHSVVSTNENIYWVLCNCQFDDGVRKQHFFLTESELEFARQHKYIYIYI